MTIVIMASDNLFSNPQNVAIENLKLSVNNDGVIRPVPAIDPYWITKRNLAIFTPAPKGTPTAFGELDAWKEDMRCLLDDLKWLLSLDYHKFWSHVVHHAGCMDMVVSFLQEARPSYQPAHPDNSVTELYNEAYKKVLIIFNRLVTNKESETEWMTLSYLGQLIYDKFLLTIPIVFDLCLLYGLSNPAHISQLVKTVFNLQPKYNEDLVTSLNFVKQIFSFIALQVDNRNNGDPLPPILPDSFKGFSQAFGGLQAQATVPGKTLTLPALHDLTLHLLDCALTLRIFLEVYPPSRHVLRDNGFHSSILNIYENTLPFIYEKVVDLSHPSGEGCDQVIHHLDIIRAEFIDAYRFIIYTNIEDILSGSQSVETCVTSYLTIITDSLSEKYFIKDYNSVYPVEVDLEVLSQVYEQMDPLKSDFILQAVMANCYDDDDSSAVMQSETTKEDDDMTNGYLEGDAVDIPHNITNQLCDIPEEAKMQSLISKVKDILPHLGDGFILKCLEKLDFNSERVINSVLEGSLDESLQALDPALPIIPQDPLDVQYLETGIDRLNVFDNDEFDVMTRDNIDLSRVHKGKRKSKHKNLGEMLNDKSHVRELKDTYSKYSLISDDVDMYEDEYDDTYDNTDIGVTIDGTGESDRRNNLKRAPLRETNECLAESEESEEEESNPSAAFTPKDSFCVNPEEVRARYQAAREMKYGSRSQRDVVGRAKGQGQDKEVIQNRQKKAVNKSMSGNHNRRSGAQWKRNQGVLPS